LVETRRQVESGWHAVADKLAKGGRADLARDVQRFVERMSTVRTEREQMAAEILNKARERTIREQPVR
jgi:hypothetical protein